MTDASNSGRDHWSDDLSVAWERHRDRLFESQRPTSDWLVEQVDPQPGDVVLELAAGPGETGFEVATRVAPRGRVISTDLHDGMVEAAKRGAGARGLDNVECRVMDAQSIDLGEVCVDAVISRFGVMLMPEPARALAGAARVLKPGGRLAYAVWAAPDTNPWLTVLAGALLEHGHAPPGNPFEPGGIFSLADPSRSRDLMGDAGFDAVVVEEISSVYGFSSFDDYWTFQSEVGGPLALLISALDDEGRARVRASAEELAEPYRSGEGLEFPSLAIGVAGSKPG